MSKIATLKKKVAELEKKQPDKAVPVYLELLEEMESSPEDMDVALFNRAGDLLLKLNRTSEAVDCYERAVDHYAEGGFFNNAIALCNKILRTSPGRSTVYYKLGRISAHKGFKADAKANFLEYADRMQKAGKMDEAFRALAEFADLCPDQTDIRLMLADQLAKANKGPEAIEQLQILHEQLTSEGRAGEAQAVATRMKAIDPSIEPRIGGSGRSQGKSGDLVFLDLGEPTSSARERRATMTAKRATQGLKIIEVDDAPRPKEPPPAPAPSAPTAPPAPTPPAASPPVRASVPVQMPELTPPPELDVGESINIEPLLPEVGRSGVDNNSLIGGFESTALDGELTRGFGFESTSLAESAPAPEPPPPLAPTPPEPPAVVPTLEFILPDGAEEPPAPPVRSSAPIQLVEDIGLTPAEPVAASNPIADLPLMEDFIAPEPTLDLHDSPAAIEPPSVESLQAAVDGNPEDWGSRRALAEAMLEAGNREGGIQELDVAMLGYERSGDLTTAMSVADEIVRIDPSSVKHHQKRVEYAYRTNDKTLLVESYLALADALFRGGQVDKSRTIYQRVLELSPADARAQAALATILEPPPEPPRAERRATAKEVQRPSANVPAQSAKRKSKAVRAAPSDDSLVNLADLLREERSPKDTRMVVAEVEPTGDEEADFADMLRKFKQGVAENVDEEDYQSHYDLGVAYKEMGLVDEAIAEFQKALRAPAGRMRTYEAIGQCFLEKGQPQMAVTILGRALNEKGVDDEQLVSVLYLMGRANEELGRRDDARQYYQRVVVVDIAFRDVTDRLHAVERAAR
jgi:tetratricopeptide (TPR) repeat protein